ncbi:MAG: restriction endonuclease subunit S [Kiritimatiellales bacterium]
MAGDWKTERISAVANVTDFVANGSFESLRNNVTYRSEPDHAILVRLVDHNAGWKSDFVYVDKATFSFLKKSVLFPGDIVIANVGANAGTVFRVPDLGKPMTLGPNAVLCRPLEGTLNRDFFYYYLTGRDGQNSITSILGGSAQPKFNKTDFRSLQVPVLPLNEQKAIAHILGTLDDKIELNQKMNETLEAMAQALFKSWFVDFDPVRAKLEGRKPAGLDPATAALFPSTFQDSPLGQIPKGWEVCPLSEKIQLLSGGTPKTSEPTYWDGDIPWYSVRDAPSETDVWVIHTDKHVTRLGIANSAAHIFPEKTTIISARGTVGKLALTAVPMAMNQSCYGVRGITGYCDYFTYYLLREATAQLQQRTHGTVFDTITTETFKTLDCIFPPPKITAAFDKLAEPLLGQIRANIHQSRTLATLRDTLLPKLLSGELKIQEAEKMVGR